MEKQERIREEEKEIDLKELFFVIYRRKGIILLVMLIFMLSSVLITKLFIKPVYVSSAQTYILNRQKQDSAITSSDLSSALQLTNDAQVVITSRDTLGQVIDALDLDMTVEQLKSMVSVSSESDTRILNISARSTDAYLARDIVDAVVEIGSKSVVEKMGVEQMNVLDNANIPSEPSSPSLKKNVLMAAVCGLILCCGVILVLYLSNDKICTVEDVERYLELTNLGVIFVDDELDDDSKKNKSKKRSKK